MCICKVILSSPKVILCLPGHFSTFHPSNSHIHLGDTSGTVQDLDHSPNIICSVWKMPLALVKKINATRPL